MAARLIALGPGAEFDRIRRIWRCLGDRLTGAGDDCAIVSVGGAQLAVSTDLSLEGVHFRLGWLTPYEVGWRAAAAALSDLAAMAAEPRGVLVSVGVPVEWPDDFVDQLMDGAAAVAHSVGAEVWGGDLNRSERVVLDVVVIGTATAPVFRSGARVGDGLWVTGTLGGPAAALAAWEGHREPDRTARERFATPRPRITEAAWLRERGATAMIDVSDGLVGDAGHLAAASAVRIAIELEAVPLHPAASSAGTAASSGEEFELLVALPGGVDPSVARVFHETFGLPLSRIGEVGLGAGVELRHQGVPVALPGGYSHF